MMTKNRILFLMIGVLFLGLSSCPLDSGGPSYAGGELDTSFDPGTGPDSSVWCIAVQEDGKIVIGGSFNNYNGTGRSGITRLTSGGTLDPDFDQGTGTDAVVYSLCLQDTGEIIMGGGFTSYNGTEIDHCINRLDADGNPDVTFDPSAGANAAVWCIAAPKNANIVIGGEFTQYDGSPRNRVSGITGADGTLDAAFDPGNGANNVVHCAGAQDSGEIVIGGTFTQFNGTDSFRVARLDDDGSLSTDFHPGNGANNIVLCMAVQGDGKIIIGGYFTSYNFDSAPRVARLNADCSIDNTFTPGDGANDTVRCIALQDDGKIIIGGDFTSYNTIPVNRIARLNKDGSLDTSFDPGTGADDSVYSIALQSDGKILIGGAFTHYNDISINHIARIR